MSVRLTREEKETSIIYSLSHEDEMAQISTSDPKMIHRLRRLGIEPEHVEREGGRVVSAEFTVPRGWIKVSPPRTATSGQRESARLAMERLNAQRTEARNAHKKRPRRRPARKEG